MTLKQFCAIIFVFFVSAVTSTDLVYYYQTKHITKDTFIGKEIKDVHFLDFRGCGAQTISNTALDDMTNLIHMVFYNNIIEYLPEGVFNKLKKIEVIQFRKNNLKHIAKRVFSNLNTINTIDLSYNLISTIEVGAFDNDNNLRFLHLSFNRLTRVPVGIFNNLQELIELDLSDNHIYKIEDSALPNFQKLTTLYLHSNKLEHLNKKHVETIAKSGLDKNPWFCDCNLKEVHAKWETTFKNQGWIPICNSPKNVHNIRWDKLTSNDFVCSEIYGHIYPEDYEIPTKIGRSLSLNCYVKGSASASEIKWTYKNNKKVNDVLQAEGRSFVIQNKTVKKNKVTDGVWYNITINEVTSSDDGIYKCVANIQNNIFEVEKRVVVLNAIDYNGIFSIDVRSN